MRGRSSGIGNSIASKTMLERLILRKKRILSQLFSRN